MAGFRIKRQFVKTLTSDDMSRTESISVSAPLPPPARETGKGGAHKPRPISRLLFGALLGPEGAGGGGGTWVDRHRISMR